MRHWRELWGVWLRRHRPGAIDASVAIGLLAFANVARWPGEDPGLTALLSVPQVLPVALRRRAPLGSLAVMVAASFGSLIIWNWKAGPSWAQWIAVIIGIYSVAAYRSRPISVPTLIGWLLVIFVWTLVIPENWDFQAALSFALLLGVVPSVGALVGGDIVRVRRNRATVLAIQAARDSLEREEAARKAMSEERARQAAAAERARIARELHDVVAHNVSVMVVQAGAARRVLTKDPTEAKRSIASVEATGRQALTEMRRLLGVVRKPDRTMELVPMPGLEQIQPLVERVREAGVEVSLEVDGLARPLPPGLELSAYRVVQEALTNVLKHAQARHAAVKLAYGPEALRIAVVDDGRGHVVLRDGDESGFGLIGLRERVALFGGELEAGNLPPGRPGYQVVATLPLPA